MLNSGFIPYFLFVPRFDTKLIKIFLQNARIKTDFLSFFSPEQVKRNSDLIKTVSKKLPKNLLYLKFHV